MFDFLNFSENSNEELSHIPPRLSFGPHSLREHDFYVVIDELESLKDEVAGLQKGEAFLREAREHQFHNDVSVLLALGETVAQIAQRERKIERLQTLVNNHEKARPTLRQILNRREKECAVPTPRND